jgi:hypothetical protein
MEIARFLEALYITSRAATEQDTMYVSTVYTPLCASRRPSPEEAYFFMMNCLLYSRIEAGYPPNSECFDEDVNVYLASLLTSLIYPRSHEGETRLVADSCVSLFDAANASAGPREKYLRYRANADHILVSLGVFKNARARRPDSVPHLALSRDGYVGRGITYYALARSYAAQTFRRNTAVGDILGKLSTGFERYLSVLSLMGGEHLNIFRQISDGEVFHLENDSRSFDRGADLKLQYDRFLDLYSSYLRKKSPHAKQALNEAVRDIHAIDPSFEFDVDKRERVKSL